MKKTLVLALATIAFAGNAFAADRTGRDKRDGAAGREERAKSEVQAREAGNTTARRAVITKTIESHKLTTKLSTSAKEDLIKAITEMDNAVRGPALAILKSGVDTPMNRALLEGLANVASLKGDARDTKKAVGVPEISHEQSYVALVLNAGKQAANWDAPTKAKMLKVLESANAKIEAGERVGEAMAKAAKEAGIDVENIKKLC